MARPRVAAGALFSDEQGRVLLVHPTYKDTWDIPGGYVEPGESPLAACLREIDEELSIRAELGRLLVVDWAPDADGDKLLLIYDGGFLDSEKTASIRLQREELDAARYVDVSELHDLVNARLVRRLTAAVAAKKHGETLTLENGIDTSTRPKSSH